MDNVSQTKCYPKELDFGIVLIDVSEKRQVSILTAMLS